MRITHVRHLCILLASPKLLLLGIVKVNFFSALAYSQLSLFINSSVAHELFFVSSYIFLPPFCRTKRSKKARHQCLSRFYLLLVNYYVILLVR